LASNTRRTDDDDSSVKASNNCFVISCILVFLNEITLDDERFSPIAFDVDDSFCDFVVVDVSREPNRDDEEEEDDDDDT
jgi:hypothetical protein